MWWKSTTSMATHVHVEKSFPVAASYERQNSTNPITLVTYLNGSSYYLLSRIVSSKSIDPIVASQRIVSST